MLYLKVMFHNLSLSAPIMGQQGTMQYPTNVSEEKQITTLSLCFLLPIAPISHLHTLSLSIAQINKPNLIKRKKACLYREVVITVRNV